MTVTLRHPAGTSTDKALPLSQEYYQSYIYPAIEAVCEKYKNYDVSIEKLTIDMAGTTVKDLAVKISATLEEKIIEEISALTAAKPRNTSIPLQKTDLWHALIHYLKTGTLPWNYTIDSKDNIEKIIQGLFSEPPVADNPHLQAIFKVLFQDKYALQRFYYIADEKFLDKLTHKAFA
ncbi:MAG TPA: contractile injection system tape measure protein, partial [Bacteroidales bacterium]|nr:contractile injection system tape measure protein [Bacteroidales bacterium]